MNHGLKGGARFRIVKERVKGILEIIFFYLFY